MHLEPQTVQKLRRELDRARTALRTASVNFDAIAKDAPSGLPHPDGVLRVKQASTEFLHAMRAQQQALTRLNEYLRTGVRPPHSARPTVLLADDHAIVLEGLRRILDPEFVVVGAVTDGMALVKAAEELRPEVIVVDISMPLLNGIEAARQIRAANQDTKVVFLSMHPDVVYVSEALRAGGSGYVLKSSAGFEVATAIREALKGGLFLSPAIDQRTGESQNERSQHSSDALRVLPRRQREVLQMVAEGRSSKEIANVLQISPRTVEFHRYRVMQSLGLHTIAELVQYALNFGLISPDRGGRLMVRTATEFDT